MQTINDTIRAAMAKAFFASAWADLQDEKDADDPTRVHLSGKEIFDVMPSTIDPAAEHAARTLEMDLARANDFVRTPVFLQSLFEIAQDTVAHKLNGGDRELTPESFGHYLAMQAMGHGVGLADAFGDDVYKAITVPYVEFGPHSLQNDY
jgi:hypothetical protein